MQIPFFAKTKYRLGYWMHILNFSNLSELKFNTEE
jgi:hypothetical protein